MKKTTSTFILSIRWIGLFGMLCLWASCSSHKLAQHTLSSANPTYVAQTDEAPQAAQTNTHLVESVEEVELVASNDVNMLPAVSRQLDASLTELAVENPKLARKMSKAADKLEKQATIAAEKPSTQASTAGNNAAQKLMAKAEKKFDIMKAKHSDAAQANTTLVALGALLAIVGLVLVLATTGTAATVGLISLVIGVVLLILSLLSN